MAEKTPQTYENHTKMVPLFHYFTMPLLLINILWSIYRLTESKVFGGDAPLIDSLVPLTTAVAVLLVAFFSRTNALKAQDRVIRLEERLRMQELLPVESKSRIHEITTSQILALRFASDEELPALVKKALDDNADATSIKQAIKNWRADHHRL